MKTLNDYFEKIYCLNLDRRTDRWEKCQENFKKLHLNVERVSAIDKHTLTSNTSISEGQLACSKSHLSMIQKAKDDQLSPILILEDDVILSDNINEVFEKNVNNIPRDWGMLYFGGNHLNGTVHVVEDIHRMRSSLTTHAYSLNARLYDGILSGVGRNWPIDVYYASIHRQVPCYVMQEGAKQLAWQDDGYSDIDEAECHYTWLK